MVNSELVASILDDMYNIVKSSLSNDVYSFKGGFILKKVLESKEETKGIRRTTDIDMSILDEITFKAIEESLVPYLNIKKEEGIIHSYKFKLPMVEGNRNSSGGVKVFYKPSESEAKRVLCGIDISYHPLDYGVIIFNDGSSVYTIERMLADKLCVMFASEDKLLRRIRDVLDIYLIIKYLGDSDNLEINALIHCLRQRSIESNVDFKKLSTLEVMCANVDSWGILLDRFNSFLKSEKVSNYYLGKGNTTECIMDVIKFINFITSRL